MSRRQSSDAVTGEGGGKQRPGIIGVARHAGVSIATVSRVLNHRGTVAPELAQRVRAAIQEMGYLPNLSARALSSGRSRLFGVIISDLTNPFFPELLQSFEERAVALGYEVLVASTAYDLQRMELCIDRMLERKVDGVAVMTFGIEGPLLSRFADRGVPLVFMDEAPEGRRNTALQVDYDAGIAEALEHLHGLGHRRVGFVFGPEGQASVARRRQAAERSAQRLQLPWTPELIFSGDHSLASGEAALTAFRRLKQRPTAVFCSNDLSAIGVMHAAESAGVRIPEDMSLIGFDGIEIGAYMVPPLTSVTMSRRAIAEAAVNALWSSVGGDAVPASRVGTSLLLRRTTGAPR